ncbi:hypothetical protein [Clostridium saccharoperbutylacetonicum]|uniref:hypothetical protein n=1 Tax=Clostridium saccharoperbutylacetonicum TaxID=36745 RepID=UPI000983FCF4|nr:hypothetical protein [Clostridium saccharoperbutylacetonicum]AQR96542.1 hypothetical protein CLSAP_38660 [Clostridium saccharoperbutylacetonicum]NSB32418.1 cellulose synthase/poly-beta-1,6-N-acetylglucosamine synthase-like glycosyltransferase [Clostridium saccharoperbutylacetonicum]
MKKRVISKLAKLNIMIYGVLMFPFFVFICSIVTHFVGNVPKYWLNLIVGNFFPLTIFIASVTCGMALLTTNIKGRIMGTLFLIIGLSFSWLIFSNTGLPLDEDLPTMITGSYSEVNGPVVMCNIKRNKSVTNTELTVHDIKQNKNITVTFEDESSLYFPTGDKIKVKYLPHSYMEISYYDMGLSPSKGNEDFLNKNPFSIPQS